MPRQARIDAPGALHHIIARGIARRKVFDDNADREFFIDRLGMVLSDTETQCFAWATLPNHFHLLLKTGATPIATVMKRLLTGYAMHSEGTTATGICFRIDTSRFFVRRIHIYWSWCAIFI
jgi:putative transposase